MTADFAKFSPALEHSLRSLGFAHVDLRFPGSMPDVGGFGWQLNGPMAGMNDYASGGIKGPDLNDWMTDMMSSMQGTIGGEGIRFDPKAAAGYMNTIQPFNTGFAAAAPAAAGGAAVAGPLVALAVAGIAWGLLLDVQSGGPVSTTVKTGAEHVGASLKGLWRKLKGDKPEELPDDGNGEDPPAGKEPESPDPSGSNGQSGGFMLHDTDGDGIPDDQDPNPDFPDDPVMTAALQQMINPAVAATTAISMSIAQSKSALAVVVQFKSTVSSEAVEIAVTFS